MSIEEATSVGQTMSEGSLQVQWRHHWVVGVWGSDLSDTLKMRFACKDFVCGYSRISTRTLCLGLLCQKEIGFVKPQGRRVTKQVYKTCFSFGPGFVEQFCKPSRTGLNRKIIESYSRVFGMLHCTQ